jgi:hypothetical protein
VKLKLITGSSPKNLFCSAKDKKWQCRTLEKFVKHGLINIRMKMNLARASNSNL